MGNYYAETSGWGAGGLGLLAKETWWDSCSRPARYQTTWGVRTGLPIRVSQKPQVEASLEASLV